MCLAVFTFDEITHNKLARLIDMSCDQRKTLVVTPMYTRGLVWVAHQRFFLSLRLQSDRLLVDQKAIVVAFWEIEVHGEKFELYTMSTPYA